MLAVIPARGGSKGLPGKNILPLQGKPLIAYTIEAALQAERITRVVVSTDCSEIAETALAFGAEVPYMRASKLATDDSRAIDVYIDALDRVENKSAQDGRYNDMVALLPTCPLRSSSDIDNAVKIFKKKNADSVVSYTLESHPVVWHKYLDAENRFENIFPETTDNRQTQRKSYYPNGAIFIFKRKILESGRYYSSKSYAYVMARSRSVDIDDIEDFKYAEYLIDKTSAS